MIISGSSAATKSGGVKYTYFLQSTGPLVIMTRISHVSLPLFFMVPRRRKMNKNRDHTTSKVYRQARYKMDKKKKFTDSQIAALIWYQEKYIHEQI